MSTYAALLRGINLGKRRIKMVDLRDDFEDWGFTDVRTALASGNVVFESEKSDPDKIRAIIEEGFEEKYGWEVPTCVRGGDEILELVAAEPFAEVPEDHNQYVTFLADEPDKDIDLPYVSIDGDYRILEVHPSHVISSLDRSEGSGTLDAMAVLEELFGANITTRTWNTVVKVHKLLND